MRCGSGPASSTEFGSRVASPVMTAITEGSRSVLTSRYTPAGNAASTRAGRRWVSRTGRTEVLAAPVTWTRVRRAEVLTVTGPPNRPWT
ncbi:hypothetical protein [Nonomuraea rubra]|uniref:hypothetical protein n=1 Tax=Nonomuraea rubra TaxID=46180 RepID=UPI0031E59DF4